MSTPIFLNSLSTTLTFSLQYTSSCSAKPSGLHSAFINVPNRNHSKNTFVASLSFHFFHSGIAPQNA